MKLLIKKGVTSKLLRVFIQNNSVTTGAGLTGLVFNSGSLTAYYIREGDASATAITLATMTVGTWATGGFKEVDATNMPGVYEIGIPNAVLATGANSVVVMLKGASNMATVVIEIQIIDVDLQDAMRFGLTALPNAVAGTNGGLPTGNASGQVVMSSTVSGAIVAASFAAGAIDASAIATDAIGSAEISAAAVTKIQAGLSTYAGGDTAGTTTLLARLTAIRAALLDNLDVTVSSRSTLTAANVWAFVIEGALTAQGVFRLVLASVANKLSGAATTTISIRDVADTKNRIVATVDSDGNRSVVTIDPS